jgi:hypothetical protein
VAETFRLICSLASIIKNWQLLLRFYTELTVLLGGAIKALWILFLHIQSKLSEEKLIRRLRILAPSMGT